MSLPRVVRSSLFALSAIAITLLACPRDAAAGGPAESDAGTQAAPGEPPAAGEYLRDGSGVLTLGPMTKKGRRIAMSTSGANGHTCGLEGTLVGDAFFDDEGSTPEERCHLTLTRDARGVNVAGSEECRFYCGVRATLDGVFERPPAGCERRSIDEHRRSFAREYSAKRYVAAIEDLEPILARCERFLGFGDRERVINDLAVAQFHAGRLHDCEATLQPLERLAKMTDRDIRDSEAPGDAEVLIVIAHATRFNLRLCTSPTTP